MERYIINHKDQYLELLPGVPLVIDENAVLDIMAACYTPDIRQALLTDRDFPEEFFELKSGLLGRIMQKFANYRFRVAFVISPDRIKGRFGQFVQESNQRRDFAFFTEKEAARNWLRKMTR